MGVLVQKIVLGLIPRLAINDDHSSRRRLDSLADHSAGRHVFTPGSLLERDDERRRFAGKAPASEYKAHGIAMPSDALKELCAVLLRELGEYTDTRTFYQRPVAVRERRRRDEERAGSNLQPLDSRTNCALRRIRAAKTTCPHG